MRRNKASVEAVAGKLGKYNENLVIGCVKLVKMVSKMILRLLF